jgi:hypothetical protein
MYLTATVAIGTPCFSDTFFNVWSKVWNRLQPPQASTICYRHSLKNEHEKKEKGGEKSNHNTTRCSPSYTSAGMVYLGEVQQKVLIH